MAQRTVLALTDEALQVIEANATQRKRREFVSAVLADYAGITGGVSDLGDDDDGILEHFASQLSRLENKWLFSSTSWKGEA